MKILSVRAIREFTRLSGKQHMIETPRQTLPKMPEVFCKTKKELALFFGYPDYYFNKPAIDIKRLESNIKGGGTRAVKKVVRESLADPETEGRVTLVAANINDSKPHPFNFYYKLGFRAPEEYYNKMAAEGKPMYKDADIFMYLPKENIEHCLNYKNVADSESSGLKYIYDRMG